MSTQTDERTIEVQLTHPDGQLRSEPPPTYR